MPSRFASDPFFLRRCPACGTGTLRRTSLGTFGCSAYPSCMHEQASDPADPRPRPESVVIRYDSRDEYLSAVAEVYNVLAFATEG